MSISDELVNSLQIQVDDLLAQSFQAGVEETKETMYTLDELSAASAAAFNSGFEAGRHHERVEADDADYAYDETLASDDDTELDVLAEEIDWVPGAALLTLANGEQRAIPTALFPDLLDRSDRFEEITEQLNNEQFFRVGSYIGRSDSVESIEFLDLEELVEDLRQAVMEQLGR